LKRREFAGNRSISIEMYRTNGAVIGQGIWKMMKAMKDIDPIVTKLSIVFINTLLFCILLTAKSRPTDNWNNKPEEVFATMKPISKLKFSVIE